MLKEFVGVDLAATPTPYETEEAPAQTLYGDPMLPRMTHEFAELQLHMVARFVDLGLGTLSDGIDRLTNFQRRLGLGDPSDPSAGPRWIELVAQITGEREPSSQAEIVMQAMRTLPTPVPEHVANKWATVGAFSIEIVGTTARTHFYVDDIGDVSPLDSSLIGTRRDELRRVLAQVRSNTPELDRVAGGTWMYSATRYKDLFPPNHLASAKVRTNRSTFRGMSHWGQFLNYRQQVRADRADEFVARLDQLGRAGPMRLVPGGNA